MFLWMMIQILIESLPISSSGHVQLMHILYERMGCVVEAQQREMIDFLLHGPAFIIMLCYFFTTWWRMVVGKDFDVVQFKDVSTYRSMIRPIFFILCADIITAVWWYSGIAYFDIVPRYVLAGGFCLTAFFLYVTKMITDIEETSSRLLTWTLKDAFILGCAQGFALMPGVSRFAVTFCTGRWLGYGRNDAFALSFLIQCPLVFAAFLKAIIMVSRYPQHLQHIFDFWMLSGIVGMSFVSYHLLCFVGSLIQRNRLWYFAWYMILPIMITVLVK